jgi:hypothetical protein
MYFWDDVFLIIVPEQRIPGGRNFSAGSADEICEMYAASIYFLYTAFFSITKIFDSLKYLR